MNPKTQLPCDTHPKIEKRLIEGVRQMSAGAKFRHIEDLHRMAGLLAQAGSRLNPLKGVTLLPLPGSFVVVKIIVETFETLQIPYLVGGSVASSMHSVARYTQDVDFVADIREEQIGDLMTQWQTNFYVDEESIREAIESRFSFNILHLPTMIKADIFIPAPDAWNVEEMRRRQAVTIGEGEEAFTLTIASAEDMILQKLVWFQLGGGVSDNQWHDVQNMLKVQSPTLDRAYLEQWAAELQIEDLLREAMDAAQLEPLP